MTLNLRHVLQFRFGGSLSVEAIVCASSIRQPSKRRKKRVKNPVPRVLVSMTIRSLSCACC